MSKEKNVGLRKLNPKGRAYVKEQLLKKYSNICQWCFERIDLSLVAPDPMSFTVDHIVRVRDGGTNYFANLQPMHRMCNNLEREECDEMA